MSKFHIPSTVTTTINGIEYTRTSQKANKETRQWLQSDQLIKQAKSAGLRYIHLYRTVSKVNGRVRIKFYCVYGVSNRQHQVMTEMGFKFVADRYGRSYYVCYVDPENV